MREEIVGLSCPYCGERITVLIDCSVDEQHYIEDCSVCCRPMVLVVQVDEQQRPAVSVRREDE